MINPNDLKKFNLIINDNKMPICGQRFSLYYLQLYGISYIEVSYSEYIINLITSTSQN